MDDNKAYYSQRETIAETGLPASTLRYWEQQFEQLNPRKDDHGNRYYTKANIELIKRIQYIRDQLHITRIAGIRRELNQDRLRTDPRQQAYNLLCKVKAELELIKSNL